MALPSVTVGQLLVTWMAQPGLAQTDASGGGVSSWPPSYGVDSLASHETVAGDRMQRHLLEPGLGPPLECYMPDLFAACDSPEGKRAFVDAVNSTLTRDSPHAMAAICVPRPGTTRKARTSAVTAQLLASAPSSFLPAAPSREMPDRLPNVGQQGSDADVLAQAISSIQYLAARKGNL